jgi:hypothetical protein
MGMALSAGCDKRPPQEAVAEAAGLSHGIDALRQAPNPEKAGRLALLRQAPCSEPRLCELKRECERAYAKHVAALEQLEKVKAELTKGQEEGLDDELDGARAALIEAEAETQSCVALQAAAKAKYQLDKAR